MKALLTVSRAWSVSGGWTRGSRRRNASARRDGSAFGTRAAAWTVADVDSTHDLLDVLLERIEAVADQNRFNIGKPKLTYYYMNTRALRKMDGVTAQNTGVAGAIDSIARWLAREDEGALAGAAIQLLHFMASELEDMEAALAAYCDVCVYGAAKYARFNYRKGAPMLCYLDSALRHLRSYQRGEVVDQDSKCLHVAHAFWNVFQALEQPDYRDDRAQAMDQEIVDEYLVCG